MNRFFFDINQRLDRHAALPAATFYCRHRAQDGARQHAQCAGPIWGGPVNVANDILELRLHNAIDAAARFVVNSTVGVAGIFDVAADWDLPEHNAISAKRWAAMACPRAPIWCCPSAVRPRCAISPGNYVDGFFSPLTTCTSSFPESSMSAGQVHHRLGGQPRQQYRDLSRHRTCLGGFLRNHADLLPPAPPAPRLRTPRSSPKTCPTSRPGFQA